MKRIIILVCVLSLIYVVEVKYTQLPDCPLDENDIFPEDFVFGSASSAYQIEGAWNLDGKGPSIWDVGTHQYPERIPDGKNGDEAADSYHKYMEDVKALNQSGFQSYRFSISWSRIMPSGEPSSLNQKGLAYYHSLIDACLEHGISISLTLYHWDLPQSIQDLGGFLNPLFVDYFVDYADVVFKEFGHKVKDFSTFNEPVEICEVGYGRPPYFGNPPFINEAQSGAEYYCAYHLLLAHARVYHMYNEKYRAQQNGKIGIVYSYNFYYSPHNDHEEAKRAMQYTVGLYAHPVFTEQGGWPEIVKKQVDENSRLEGRTTSRLPVMSEEIKAYIRGTADWFGLNYYSSFLIEPDVNASSKVGIAKDKGIIDYKDEEWETAESEWLHNVPEGFRDAMNFIGENYGKPDIRITENGWSDKGELKDEKRIQYFKDHLRAILKVLKCDGLNISRYYAWSIIDNFEWMAGYTKKFGLYHVDYNDPEKPRTAKDSAKFFAEIIKARKIPDN